MEIPLTGGTWVLNTVATSRSGATARDVRTVVFDFTPGTVLLRDLTDPDGDDNGPGNYAYPTSPDFHDGAFDIQQFQVLDAGDNVTFRLKTRNLSPTFGSPLGAQLVDVYVHVPGASPTSTAGVVPAAQLRDRRGGRVEPPDRGAGLRPALRRRERGDAGHGDHQRQRDLALHHVQRAEGERSARRPRGWGFTVVLTGQDGFSPDQARGFQPTPEAFQFGVCATASTDPHCTFDPGQVPKAVDVLTPGGVSQADELDYTIHSPVTIAPVTIP